MTDMEKRRRQRPGHAPNPPTWPPYRRPAPKRSGCSIALLAPAAALLALVRRKR